MPYDVSPNVTEGNTLDAVLIEKGWLPIPVQAASKRPLIKDWPNLPATVEALAECRRNHPDHQSTGIRTGRVVGVDVDTPVVSGAPLDYIGPTDFTSTVEKAIYS